MVTETNIALGTIGLVSMLGWMGMLGVTIWAYCSQTKRAIRLRKLSFGLLAVLLVVFMATMFVIESRKPHSPSTYQEYGP